MKMKKVFISAMSILTLIMLVLPVACAPARPQKVYEWTFICPQPFNAVPWVEPWAKAYSEDPYLVENGFHLKLLQYGEHPYDFPDILSAVGDRGAEMGINLTVGMTGLEPIFGITDLPFLLSCNEAIAMFADPAYSDILDKVWYEPMDRQNVKPLGLNMDPQNSFTYDEWMTTSKEPLKGKRIRAQNEIVAAMIEKLGGIGVALPMPEVGPALQRGVIDGVATSVDCGTQLHWYEMIPYCTMTDHMPSMGGFFVNKDAWAELPKDLQDRILAITAEQEKIAQEWQFSNLRSSVEKATNEQGMKYMVMDPALRDEIRELMKPIWYDWVDKIGPPAPEILQRMEEFHEKYVATR
jgi:TRAP-type C4-dicarboxylate transport system substrate-binding protein